MEALYIKLYEKYSKLKGTKDGDLDKINQDQEVKFMEFVSAAECLIEHLTTENKRFCQNIDELRMEVHSLRTAKDQQFDDFQERLVEEKQKNQQLSAEIEQLRKLQQEGLHCSNMSDRHENQHVNNIRRSLHVSGDHLSESPMRMTRKRSRLSAAASAAAAAAANSPSDPGYVELSTGRELSADSSSRYVSNVNAPQPDCCQSHIDGGGLRKCFFQGLLECLIGMKVSVFHQPEGRSIRAIHQSSGYSFSLKWLENAAQGEGELLYNVSSLGTFTKVAPEWMREVIIFNMSMCPVFFERVSRVIKQC